MSKKHKIDDLIEPILSVDSKAQDDDLWLQCRIMSQQSGCNLHNLYEFLSKMPNLETIRRRRQLLQAKKPELRGQSYNKRHKIAQEVRQDYSPTFEEKVASKVPWYNK